MNKVYLTREDINKIDSILQKFPGIDNFCLDIDSSSGIGSTIDMQFYHEANGVPGLLSVVIADETSW